MSDTGEEWQVARRRKGAARKSKSFQVSSNSTSPQEQLDIGKTVKRIRDTVSELRCEEFWHEWKGFLSPEQLLLAGPGALLKPPENKDTEETLSRDGRQSQQLDCVCYGLGSFSSCVSARYQLALLLLLLDAGQIPLKDCSVYDPAFSSGERDVLRELGLTVLTENEEGKRLATKPTLFYLMHCGKALYNNLLWKNWSTQCLPLMIIIGNSFNGMRDRTIEREFKRDYGYITQAVCVCEERPLPCPSRLIDVFSDTAVITFPNSNLDGLPQSTWVEPPEPQYGHCPDLEIIERETQSRDRR
ncbi:SRR1-like protein isoform X1 [Micropterus dolomieu]|uniref:SRR1-like protein isoform X1 n=1 Tax=Micropterus dolomieu TaxID=147949 RepID=UPI001E8D2777|nr:SRR1-like protein isoform X1 [Micropterus dolomieu]XP_045890586.1 SRR1-like protein isoform X1 [Micropterus dolomieu]